VALITSSGAPSRRGEEQAVAEALAPRFRLEWLAEPATLDGGDCLRLDKRWYVGRSQRTNAAGVAGMRRVFEPLGFEVIEVALGRILHLKCVCSALDDDSVLLAENTLPPRVFDAARIITVPAAESFAANCLSVGGVVLLPAGYPATRRLIEAGGWQVAELDMSEIRKADGSMTCLSILFE
jgi:dimethylargininase